MLTLPPISRRSAITQQAQTAQAKPAASTQVKPSGLAQWTAACLGISTLFSSPASSLAQEKPAQPPVAAQQAAQTKHEPSATVVEIDKKLRGDGVTGRIHGADVKSGLLVFNYFSMNGSVIDSVNLSVIAGTDEAQKVLDSVKRHDKVLIKGRIKSLSNPQPHIIADSVEIKDTYKPEGPLPAEPFKKTTALPDELKDKEEATFLVHANVEKGKAIVLEYKDQLVMLIAKDPKHTQDLWRGDRIKVRYTLRNFPGQPTHLFLNLDEKEGKQPILMLDKLGGPDRGNPEKPAPTITQEGFLVKFPKSPAINRDIWAIEQKDPDGASRYFTLVNFEIEGEFDRIDAACRKLWDSANKPTDIADGRNKQIHKSIKIKVSGTLNVEQPNQANAQIFLKAEDIQISK